jgi:hypothetical protein
VSTSLETNGSSRRSSTSRVTIREIVGRLFSQNFRANYEAEHGIPFCVVTPEPSIPELEEEPVEKAQDQWEIGSNNEIPGFGNFD